MEDSGMSVFWPLRESVSKEVDSVFEDDTCSGPWPSHMHLPHMHTLQEHIRTHLGKK